MTTEDRKVQIVAEVDATPAKAGFAEVKAAGRDMANAVAASGRQAGEGVKKVGDGADPAAQKLDRATKSIIASIQRSTAAMQAGGQANAQYFESIAQQRGINVDVLRPYLKGLDDAVAKNAAMNLAMHGSTVSAKQMQQALQGVPAQFTDIVTSIASGQAPLTVFLQQGGQLKDMFGGAGNAARALGGYVTTLINPFTLAAGGAAALAVAYYQGSKEADALSRALIMTGNAAGASTAQLQDMAKAVAAAVGSTQGSATEAIAAAAGTGKVAAANIELVSQAAIKLNRAVGASIQDTINDFAELGKEPVKASEKLNEKYNYLTASIYQQIKALEDQGKTLEAAALAQKAYADAMSGRADAVVQNLGTIERAWKGIIDTSKRAWDAMLGVGRQATLADQIAEQKKLIDGLRDGSEVGNIDVAQKRLATLEAMAVAQGKEAAATAAANQQEQARIAWLKDSDKYLTKAEQMERAITKARNEGAAAGASQAEIEKRIAKIREDMTDKARQPRTGKSQQVKDAEELARILDRINGNASGLDASYYTDLQKLFKAYGGGKLTIDQYRDAVEKLTLGQKFYKDTLDAQAKAQKEAEKAQSDYFNHWQKYLGSLDQEAQKLEEQNMLWGLGKQALADMALIRAEETLAKARDNGVSDEYLAKLEQEVELRRRIASATGSIEVKEANKKAADDAAREWLRVSEDISRGLTDAIFRGGKDGWSLLADTIKATAIRAYVQPVIQGGINSLLGSVIGAPAGQGGGLFGGVGSLASAGMQAAGLSGLGGYTGAAGFLQLGSMASSFTTGLGAVAGGADLTAAIAAYNAAGMGATAAGLGAGASAAGALGSSAGMVGSALSGVATAAPYLAAALFVANQLGAFKGPTYHKGGAYLADTAGGSQQATAANFSNFNLGWGAYRSDRLAGYDQATRALSTGLATQLASSVAAYGGKSTKLTVATRFASDNDDWSEGAIRIVDEAGKRVFDFTKRYTKDSAKALEQFTADSTRALVGALKASGLSGAFDALFSTVDPLKASIEDLNAVMSKAATISDILKLTGADVLTEANAASLSAMSQFLKASDTLQAMATAGSLSLDQMKAAAQDYYSTQLGLLTSLNAAGKSVSDTLAGSVRDIRYNLLDEQGKYNMLDQEAVKALDVLKTLTDPELITQYVARLNDTLNQAYALIPDGLKEDQAQAFIDRFGQVETLAQGRIDTARQQVLDDQKQMATTLTNAIITAFGGVAPAIEAAAEGIPKTISISITGSAASAARTEVGY